MTSRKLTIPQNRLDNPVGGSFKWDTGDYEASVVDVRENDYPPTRPDGTLFDGFASEDCDRLSIHLGALSPLESQNDPGEQRIFMDVVTRDGSMDLFDLTADDFENRDIAYWQLRNSAIMLAKLARAHGSELDDDFMENLVAGNFNNDGSFIVNVGRVTKSGKPIVTDIS